MKIHLIKKDFKIDWFSGTGAGGQHRNKHQNCCRIIHIDTGIKAQGTASKERIVNQKEAFSKLAKRLAKYLMPKKDCIINTDIIRNYNESRNEVHDKTSELKQPYKTVINDIGPMIESRRQACIGSIAAKLGCREY